MSTKPTIAADTPSPLRLGLSLGRADLLSLTLIAATAFFMLSHLDRWRPWFDEGWTFEAGETWVDQGYSGVLATDGPRGKSIAAALPTVAPVALSFRLLGVGIWQGRLPVALLMLGGIGLLAALARQHAGPRVAATTLLILLATGPATLNPIGIGSQGLAEPAMVFWLAAAYLALPSALAYPWPWMGLFWLCAGLGISAKVQPMPFVVVSLLTPAALALAYRRQRTAAMLGLALAGALVAQWALQTLPAVLWPDRFGFPTDAPGLVRTVALSFDAGSRVTALANIVAGPGLATVGIAYALWRLLGHMPAAVDDPRATARSALLALAGSWAAWYLLLSIGWTRFLFLPAFFGALFAAEMIARLTGGFNLRATIARLAPGPGALRNLSIAVALILIYLYSAGMLVLGVPGRFGDSSLVSARAAAVGWLNTNTSPDALIETYDPELLLGLDRPFHYPPDRHHAEIILMEQQRPGATTRYEPLALAPDYIAEGVFSRDAGLYREAIAAGGYRLVFEQQQYRIYARP